MPVRTPGSSTSAANAEVALGHLAQRGGDPRHARRDRDAVTCVVEREAVEAEELLEHERELVGRALGDGGDAPVVDQLAVVEEADDGLGVAAVDGEQHGSASFGATIGRRSKAMSSAGADCVITLVEMRSAPASA